MPLDCTYESIIKLNIELSISKVSVKTGYHSKYRNICGSIEPVYAPFPSRFVTGRRFFNTDRPSDFVPMAFIIYTCARYPQTQARAHNRVSTRRSLLRRKIKKKEKRRRKEIEERKVKLRRGSVIERFCFCSFFFFFEVWCFLRRRRSNRLETGVAESRKIFTIHVNHCNSTTFPFFSFILSRARGKRIIGERIVFFKINQNSVSLSQSVSRCKSF